jgi:hypothetical protein
MLFESCGDPWMRQLEQCRATRTEEQRCFAVDPPTHGLRPEYPCTPIERSALDGRKQRLTVAP